MSFVNPMLFWLMVIPFFIFSFLISTNKERLTRISDEKVLKRLSVVDETIPVQMRNIIMFIALFLMIVALARPVIEKGDKTVEIKGLTLLVALDISGSMRSTDLFPNRLEFAKKKMFEFFENMPSDEIGVLAFAHSPFILAPFSTDKQTLQMMVEGVDESYITMGSTDFLALGVLADETLATQKPKIMVLFTDGGDEEAIAGFSDILAKSGIDLYVVLVGTTKGAPVLTKEGKPYVLEDGTIAMTQRNDAFLTLAQKNGGIGIVATQGSSDMVTFADTIHQRYHQRDQGEVQIKERIELFYYPLGMGLFFLLIATSSIPKQRRA